MASKPPPSERLAAWLAGQRWFGAKSRHIVQVEIEDSLPLTGGTLHVLRVILDGGDVQRYAALVTDLDSMADALDAPAFVHGLVALAREGGRRAGRGALTGHRTRAFPASHDGSTPIRKLAGEQSNTSVVIGGTLIMKHFRRLAPGLNPDLEITRYLTEMASFAHTPPLAGWLEYASGDGEPSTVAVIQHLVTGARDGWEWMLQTLRDDHRRDDTLAALRALGLATAELHLALASAPSGDLAMRPEAVSEDDIARWTDAVAAQLVAARAAASRAGASVPLVAGRDIAAALATLRGRVKCRHHGDFHLGQTLYRAEPPAWSIIDFEGEPLRPLAERRQKHAPLRDVAGMLRSLAYAAETVRREAAGAWIDDWERAARAAFVDSYVTAAGSAAFVPDDRARLDGVVAAFEVEKAAYEVVYEANNRPEWIGIPLAGLVKASRALPRPPSSGAA
jgi:trehalose synthase-fused probable maltokinase